MTFWHDMFAFKCQNQEMIANQMRKRIPEVIYFSILLISKTVGTCAYKVGSL